jgi:hypothetical protein
MVVLAEILTFFHADGPDGFGTAGLALAATTGRNYRMIPPIRS